MISPELAIEQDTNDSLAKRIIKFSIVLGAHAALLALVLQAQIRSTPEPAPIRLDVRTIEIPPPAPPAPPKPVVQPPKPLPQVSRPITRPQPAPVTPPPVMTAAPSTEPAFSAPPQPQTPVKVEPAPAPSPPPPPPAVVTQAQFDADYLRNPKPRYPPMSQRLREEGEVLLMVRVSAKGDAEDVRIHRSSNYSRLDEAAINTVRQWRFIPARRGDEAVAASVVVPIIFRLDS